MSDANTRAEALVIDDDTHETLSPARYRLYDRRAVVLATFLGTPFAGGSLMYLNERRLGRAGGRRHLLVAAGIFFPVVAIALALPDGFPSIVFTLAQMFGMGAYFDAKQGAALEAHAGRGGRLESRWLAAGVGLVGLLLVGGALFAFFYLFGDDSGALTF